MSWWWLTFKADNGQTLGTCVVEGSDLEMAGRGAKLLRIHPGGTVEGFEIPADKTPVPPVWCNRLLTPSNAKALGKWTDRMWGTSR